MIETVLSQLEAGGDLSMEQMSETIALVMEGECSEDEIARLLVGLHRKGETVAEVAGAARAMRKQMTPIRTGRQGVVDVVGTGGDRSGTFNISTAAALVAAAAGVPVAKHGNRRVTSPSGAADVLAELGVNIEADVPLVEACLDELGICFCFAPLLHKAMKHVAPVRKKLGMPTIFNILGPLANPAGAPFQLLGVGKAELRPLLSEAISLLGARRVLVVHGADGLDEVTLGGTTYVTEAAGGRLREFEWNPADCGLAISPRDSLLVDGPQQSAAMIRDILDDRPGPPRDIVVLNAAAALWTVGRDDSPAACARLAHEAIQSGAAKGLLARLVERTNQ
ncbi:MAG: anthranilate phosphoribosyltransferase [Planctomycetes bacterium RBG_16_64_12]|nr:MAG: anthranilate phosphoribosyltransferase [Planctomycetes bacterium RBG_16_64_12]